MEAFGNNSILSVFNETNENQLNQSITTVGNLENDSQNTSTEVPPVGGNDILLNILEVLQHANYVLLPTMLIFGLTGNTLTIIIMTSRRYAHLTSRLLLIALALSDTLLLLTQPFNKIFVIKMTGIDLRALSDIGCKIYFFLFRTSKMTSSWFVVLLCIERFIAVWFPFRAKVICTQRNTLLSISTVYVVIGTYNAVWGQWSSIVNGRCHPDGYDANDPGDKDMFGRFLIGGCNLYSFIPTAIMVILTPLIIKKLLDHKKKRKAIASQKNKQDETRITFMLLGIVTAFIILILPVTFLHLFSFLIGVRAFGQNPNGFLIFRDVTQILEQVNYAINFVLYVTTSKQFRSGLADLFYCRGTNYLQGYGSKMSSYNSRRKLPSSYIASADSESGLSNKASVTTDCSGANVKDQSLPKVLPCVEYP
ncbi:growth hormone secretagogue receptor type 1-like [Pecten maximus]|uniref:growth hormone secretagogue receptor type 1-like n=1 Tax=Pecten maximus TaxID=6579 RepID=UPI0014584BC8|nr:growth hormone secretagogue receptor type 1-like [Pecten maximus]